MVKNQKEKKVNLRLNFDHHSTRFYALLFPAIYLIAITVFCVLYNVIPGPEFLIFAFLIYATYNKRTWLFLKAWLPFITIFVSYEMMFSIVGTVSQYNLHQGPYLMEMQLFGQLPTTILQQSVRTPILDYLGAFFYSLHFFAPTIFAFILWRKRPKDHLKYTIAFGVCTYGALITFLFYAVAPPWIAVPGVMRVLTGSVDANLGIPVYRTLFDYLSPNLYAAFPSMHSALPMIISLFALKIWRIKALPIFIFPIGVWFSAVYLGEHYVIDVLGGIFYAIIAFLVAYKILPYLSKKTDNLKAITQKNNS